MAVAALITCAVFATATGIVGAVVTLMGLLAFPAMLKAGYDTRRCRAGVICAGGTLGILIPPSIMLIVYGATAGVSVVRLYAAAMLPGLDAGRPLRDLCDQPGGHQSRSSRRSRRRTRPDIPFSQVCHRLLTSFFPLAVLITCGARLDPLRPGDPVRGGGGRAR